VNALNQKRRDRIEAEILDLYDEYYPILEEMGYVWEWEADLWNTLVISVLAEISGDMGAVLDAMPILDRRTLIIVEELAMLPMEPDDPHLEAIKMVLVASGISPEHAEVGIKTICALAKVFMEEYDGNLQRFLRKYTRMMIEEVQRGVIRSEADTAAIARALVTWCQKTLNLPLVSLSNPRVERFCKRWGITAEELEAIADDLGLSATIINDLIIMGSSEQSR